MLVRALSDRFEDYFAQDEHHDTVLWFDPEGEYAALLAHLTGLPLWRYEDSLLLVRYRLIQRAPGERAVVYLPLAREQAESLRPFFATSLVFRERLYKLLRRQGLAFPDDPDVAHELRALLPRLAARSVGKGRAFWEYNLANLERARETLIGSFDDALLRFLSQPQVMLAELKREKLDGLFFAQLESAYGLVAAPEDDPGDVAQRLTAQLALARAFTGAGQPADFPYTARLPEPLYFERCEAFLDRWQRDALHKTAYVRLVDGLEKRYNLAGWVSGLPLTVGMGLKATFADVETILWQRAEAAMNQLASEAEWRDWLEEHKAHTEGRASSFWAQEGRAPGWGLMARAGRLLTGIGLVRDELDRLSSSAAFLDRYAETWWQVDHDFRLLREALDAQPVSYDWLRERCARAYRQILRRMNDRFCTLLDAEKTWPPAGMMPQEQFWASAEATARPGQRMAVMFVDALRYELAQELFESLEKEGAGSRRDLGPCLAAIPTVTGIGMSALLPGGDRRVIAYGSDWDISLAGSGNLKDKSTRQQWLAQQVPGVKFYNLGDLLNTPTDRIPEVDRYVVFETTLDQVGETASQQAWNVFSTLLQSVKKGVHKLLALGVSHVHIVADHGFLLLDEVGEHEKVSVRDVPALAKKSRYVLGHHLGHTEQLSFPVPGSEGLTAWYPRGIGCFRTPGPYNYVHGGLSLQELVVPHLVVSQQVVGRTVRVEAELPSVIRNAQFKVELAPSSAELFDQPRQVSLSLEKAGEPVVPALSCVVGPGGPAVVDVFLPMGCGLVPGDRVRWVLRDAVTDEVLAEQEATSQVDLW